MLSHKPSVIPKFDIEFPNNNRIFTTQLNDIKGQVKLKFNKKCKNITNIEIGFKGDVRSRHLRKESMKNSIYSKIDVIFNHSKTLLTNGPKNFPENGQRRDTRKSFSKFNRSSLKGGEINHEDGSPFSFPSGYILEYPFHFQFQTDHYELPSSCDSLCSRIPSSKDNITVRYEVYIRITYLTKNDIKFMDFLVPLMFQGDSLSLDSLLYNDDIHLPSFNQSGGLTPFEKPPSHMIAEAVTMDKLKVYSPDIELGGLKLNEPHIKRSSTLIKKLKRKLTKKISNPMLLSNNVTLAMIIEVPAIFNLASDLADLPISFVSTSHFGPLELQYNGISTTLGLFEVDSIKVSIIQHVMLNGTNYDNKKLIYKSIFNEGKKRSVDIKDFQFDHEHGEYIFKTNLGYLIDDPTPLFDKLTKPLMQNCTIADYLICENSLQISLTLSTKNTTTSTTLSTPDSTPKISSFNSTNEASVLYQTKEIKKCRLSAATKLQCNFSNSQITKYKKANHKSTTFYYNRHYIKSKPRSNKGTGGLLNSEKKNYLGKSNGGSVIAGILSADENDEFMDSINCGYYQNCCYDSGDGYQTVGQECINANYIVNGITGKKAKKISKKLVDDGFGVLGDYCWLGFGIDGKYGGFGKDGGWFRHS